MGYVEENLLPGEKIALRAHLSKAMFVVPAIVAAVGWVPFVLSLFNSNYRNGCLAVLVMLVGLFMLVQAGVIYSTTEFAVTDKRIIAKAGFLHRRSLELMLTKVESIRVDQSFMGGLFNYGTIVVAGTGGTKESFPNIAYPMEFKIRINAQIAGAK